jgi:hypothetical protein
VKEQTELETSTLLPRGTSTITDAYDVVCFKKLFFLLLMMMSSLFAAGPRRSTRPLVVRYTVNCQHKPLPAKAPYAQNSSAH